MKNENEMNKYLQELANARPITPLRNGRFDDCVVSGQRYEDQDGSRFWNLTVVSADNYRAVPERVNLNCFVFGNEFHCRASGINVLNDFRHAICRDAAEIDPVVKRAVLTTIRKWEGEEACAAKTGLER
jgi:hypothetical protein